MKSKYIKLSICSIAIMVVITSCKKFLDTKPDQRLSTPDTIEDLQALLDNESFYKYGVGTTQTSTDEYYVPFTTWQTRLDPQKMGYIWDPKVDDFQDWNNQYGLILITNTVLDRVAKFISESPDQRADEIKGSALFLRSYSFFQLAQLFAPQYDPATAESDLGIVLRLEPDFNLQSTRSTVQQTYDQIINDLLKAVTLLPDVTVAKTRPTKAAGYALLARTYLQIGDYQNAKTAAEKSLTLYSDLIDYNNTSEISAGSSTPILKMGILNKEIIYYQNEDGSLNRHSTAKIDSVLYRSYDVNDIRATAFFLKNTDNTYRFKGSYNGTTGQFVGLGTPELYLIKAECNARLGNVSAVLQDLNSLLVKRYKPGKVPTFNPSTPEQALTIVLIERKKEMLNRGVRWSDLKRLNKNPSSAVVLVRDLNGAIYTLPPNDLRYTLLIPESVMQIVNLPQNPR